MEEDIDNTIRGEQLARLKSMIGKKLISMEHAEPFYDTDIPQRIRFYVEGKRYTLDNRVDWSDHDFSMPDHIPHMVFIRIEDEPEWNRELVTCPIGEKITDILLVNDHVGISKYGKHDQNWESTEAVVIVTDVRQYGFFKDNTWLDETVLYYRGQDVLLKLKPIKNSWYICGKPCDADVTRFRISLEDERKVLLEKGLVEGEPDSSEEESQPGSDSSSAVFFSALAPCNIDRIERKRQHSVLSAISELPRRALAAEKISVP